LVGRAAFRKIIFVKQRTAQLAADNQRVLFTPEIMRTGIRAMGSAGYLDKWFVVDLLRCTNATGAKARFLKTFFHVVLWWKSGPLGPRKDHLR
jgi:hypothetical protein